MVRGQLCRGGGGGIGGSYIGGGEVVQGAVM